ncbi:MAG: hypothetical protein LBL34_05805 [Clostridiales bacterium]|jgi:TolA-binding protein|nr:hypothetical protein [Clostridiales bacterium]
MHKKNVLFASGIGVISAFFVIAAVTSIYQISVAPTLKGKTAEVEKAQVMQQKTQASLASLTLEKEELRAQLDKLREENEILQMELTSIYLQNNESLLKLQALDGVMEAEDLFKSAKYKASRERVSAVDPSILSARGRTRYDDMGVQLKKKGY